MGLLLLTGCQPGKTGTLELASGTARGHSDVYDRPTALISSGGLSMQVSGSWTTRLGANTIDLRITYRNTGARPVLIRGKAFEVLRAGDRGWITNMADMTGVDLTDDRTDNDMPRQFVESYEAATAAVISSPPGGARTGNGPIW